MLLPMSASSRSGPRQPGSLESLRRRNRDAVVGLLRDQGALTRAEVARRSGLSRSTVSTVVADLIRDGVVGEDEPGSSTGSGRPGTPLLLKPGVGALLAVDLTTTGVSVDAYDLAQTRLGGTRLEIDARAATLDAIVDAVVHAVDVVIAETGIARAEVIGAVMAIPAPIEERSRFVGLQSGIAALVGPTLEHDVAERLGMPVMLENDANLSAIAEVSHGVATGHTDVIYLEVSEGIGAGIIVDGRLHRGARGLAGEIGHTPLVPDGPVCRCGNRGCLELIAGTAAITGAVGEQSAESVDIDQVIARAGAGDPMCRRVLRDAGARIGTVVGSICNLINPTVVIIGGALASAWVHIEPALRESLDRSAIQTAIEDLTIVPSSLSGPQGRLIGARTLLLRERERFPAPHAA